MRLATTFLPIYVCIFKNHMPRSSNFILLVILADEYVFLILI